MGASDACTVCVVLVICGIWGADCMLTLDTPALWQGGTKTGGAAQAGGSRARLGVPLGGCSFPLISLRKYFEFTFVSHRVCLPVILSFVQAGPEL